MGERTTLYRELVAARVRSDLQYRTSFVLFTFSQFAITFLDFIAILVLFSNVSTLAGWSLTEVAFLYGLANLAFGLADVFVSPIENVQVAIRTGSFDQVLLRPVSPIVQVVTDGFSARRLGKLAQGVLVFGFAVAAADIHWTVARAGMTVIAIVSAATIFSALWVATTCISFWWVEAREAANAITYGGSFLAQYPLGVYGPWLRRLLAYAVPIAFANYYPATYILGRTDRLGAPSWIAFASPLVALAVAALAALAWRVAVRHYRSTGS